MYYLKIILFLFLIITATDSKSQNDSLKCVTPFDKGIMLENTGILIPWGLSTNKLTEIGNPKIDTLKGKYLNVLWKDVIFFGGLKGSIKYNPKKTGKNEYTKLFNLYALIDNSDLGKAISYFNSNICTASEKKKWNGKYVQYIWRTDIILVQIIEGGKKIFINMTRSTNGI